MVTIPDKAAPFRDEVIGDPFMRLKHFAYSRLAQKRWMRRQDSSSSSADVA
jgi:hypothetical protein